jgi:hypothetical protein
MSSVASWTDFAALHAKSCANYYWDRRTGVLIEYSYFAFEQVGSVRYQPKLPSTRVNHADPEV